MSISHKFSLGRTQYELDFVDVDSGRAAMPDVIVGGYGGRSLEIQATSHLLAEIPLGLQTT